MSDQAIREQSIAHDQALAEHGIRFEARIACRVFGHWSVATDVPEWPSFQGIPSRRQCLFCRAGLT
jgi:hypothetical protein